MAPSKHRYNGHPINPQGTQIVKKLVTHSHTGQGVTITEGHFKGNVLDLIIDLIDNRHQLNILKAK